MSQRLWVINNDVIIILLNPGRSLTPNIPDDNEVEMFKRNLTSIQIVVFSAKIEKTCYLVAQPFFCLFWSAENNPTNKTKMNLVKFAESKLLWKTFLPEVTLGSGQGVPL